MDKDMVIQDAVGTNILSKFTADIIAQRKDSRSRFESYEKELFKIKTTTDSIIKNSSSDLWKKIIEEHKVDEIWNDIIEKAQTLSTSLNDFMSDTGLFYLAKVRADRQYVNVGSVGVTQEGKSEFNASIASLKKGIVPIGGGSKSCTTARINIINGMSPDGKTNIVRVHYHTVNSFSKLLYSYLLELGATTERYKDLLSVKSKNELRLWIQSNKGSISDSQNLGDDKKIGKKIAVQEYFTNVESYIDKLGCPSEDYSFEELTSGKDEHKDRAEEYYSSVSYFKKPGDNKKVFNSFATEKAEVFSQFNVGNEQPINNLQFLDTPGIGEDRPGLERILAKSVSSDLDIIIAIRAARNIQTDLQRTTLIAQLRSLLNKRPKSQEALYFIQNLWDQVDFTEGENEKANIQQRLETVGVTDPIVLDDSHFRTINILKGYEVDKNGNTNYNHPVHNYLLSIFKQLIPKIKGIDEEYFEDAEKEYIQITNDFSELKIAINKLSNRLPSDDMTKQIEEVCSIVAGEWKTICSIDDEAIIGEIQCDLGRFCDQETGIVLCDVLGIEKTEGIEDFDEENEDENYEYITDFVKNHSKEINICIDKPSWNAGAELKCYAELKAKLLEIIEERIFSYINVDEAEKKIIALKCQIAELFRTNGKLSFVSVNKETWWQEMSKLLNEEQYPEDLTKLISGFSSFSIDYRSILKKSIEKVIHESRHADNFGNPETYFFSSWEDAKKSITHSLLCIEKRVQSLVEEDVYREELGEVVSLVNTHINNLRELTTYGKQVGKTPLREAWEQFYKKHAKEIFVDNDIEKKRALISDWNKLSD